MISKRNSELKLCGGKINQENVHTSYKSIQMQSNYNKEGKKKKLMFKKDTEGI